jgi:hypothetical protein
LGLRDDREDFNGFVRDVIEHPQVSYSQPKLRLPQSAEPSDPAPAHFPGLVPQVRFERISDLGSQARRQAPIRPRRFWRQGDLEAHSGQSLAITRRLNKES